MFPLAHISYISGDLLLDMWVDITCLKCRAGKYNCLSRGVNPHYITSLTGMHFKVAENELWAVVGKKSKPICSSFQPTYDFDLDCGIDMKAPLVVKWKEVNYI